MILLKKLRINPDEILWLINIPQNCAALFHGIEQKEKLGKEKPVQQLILFAHDSKELNYYLPLLEGYIAPETLFWICYPKKSGAISSDLIRMEPWNILSRCGYRGQTSVSVNDDWSGMRFTNAPRKKPSLAGLPIEERKVEGIDFIKRTVTLPADAQAAIDRHAGMSACFYSQSFTCKKEHLMAITEARKEETRRRRIEKMIDMLQQKMAAK
jgi:hypothetical protein